MAWRLNSFFGCGRLETGGRVIGGLQLFFSLFAIISEIVVLVGGIAIINDPKTSPEDVSTMESMAVIKILIVLIVLSVINCIIAIFLIVGTNNQNPRYILVWLIVTFITNMASLILSNFAAFNIVSWVIFVFWIYLYLCIYSLYVKVKEEPYLVSGGQSSNYGSVPSSA